MNSHRLLPHRLAAGSFLALAAMLSAPHALAFINDHPVPLEQSPDWAVFLDKNCSATQITAHVAISTGSCVDKLYRLMYPKISAYTASPHNAQSQYSGQDRYGPVGNVGIAFTVDFFNRFNEDLKPANILSYTQEKRLLVDGNDDLTRGANLSLYASTPGDDLWVRNVTSTDWYLDKNSPRPADSRPLIFRSLQKYRQLEPQRFNFNNPNPVMPLDLLNYFYVQRQIKDQQINAIQLLVTGLDSDPDSGIANPITPTDVGGGIFYKAPDGTLSLAGIISGTKSHVRLSHYWPWVYSAIKEKGTREEAITFSRKVLGTGEWGTNDRKANIGDIFVYDNPYTNEVEFFRLINRGGDLRYWYFPIDRKDNYYWQYLGTSLPTFEQATATATVSAPSVNPENNNASQSVIVTPPPVINGIAGMPSLLRDLTQIGRP